MPVRLLFEEGPCLVVNKPFGVLTQAPPGIDSVEVRVRDFLRFRDQKQGNVYLGVPHRLDRPVSGTLVLARNVRASRRISDQFAGRLVRKTYWAIVAGHVAPHQGTWVDFMRKIPNEPKAEIVARDHQDAKHAELEYRVVQTMSESTWLEIELKTGRTHQIRVQTAARGFPVLGDTLYGGEVAFGPQTDDVRARAIALHARSIAFRHPMTQVPIAVTAPVPPPWKSVLE